MVNLCLLILASVTTTWMDSSLTNSSLTNTTLTASPLTITSSTNTTLTASPLTNTSSTTSPLTNTSLTNSSLTNTTLTASPLTNTSSTTSPLTNTSSTNSSLMNSSLTNTTLTTCPLTNTSSTNTTLTTSLLTNTSSTTSPLTNTSSTNSSLMNSSLTNTTLTTSLLTNTSSTIKSLTNSSLTNTTLMNTTQMFPQCLNGGRETNGFCLCPNNVTGTFCELSNFCRESNVNGFTYPETVIGQAGYSKEACIQGTQNAGFPKATAWCLPNNTFAPPQKLDCDQTLNSIDQDLSNYSSNTILKLASNTQILTSKPDKLTMQNISAAANIVNKLLSKSNETAQDVSVAAVTTVSQLLNARAMHFDQNTTEIITKLTKTLQEFSLTQANNGSLLVQPNIAIQSFTMTQSSKIQMIVFSALKNGNQPSGDSSDTFSADRIKINDTSVSPSDQFPIDVQMFVQLNKTTNMNRGGPDIGFVLYNNDQFFRSKVFQPSLNMNRRVITASLKGQNVLVNFTMNHKKVSSVILYNFACVIWDDEEQDWRTKGCEKIWDSAHWSCRCEGSEKFANFAMLMSFRTDPEIAEALSIISIIGCALSVVCLTITIMFQILTRKSRRSSPTVLMVSICVCMTIVYLLFIFGINNSTLSISADFSDENIIPLSDFHQDPDYGPCTVVTVLLHYFLLAAFTWSMLYAVHIFLLIKNTISGPPQYFSVLSIVLGWGLPAVVVGITLGITYRTDNPLNYRQEALCWLAVLDQNKRFDGMKPMLWSFLLPVFVMLVFNIAVFFYFSYATCRKNPDLNSSQVTPIRNKMLGCVSMAVVLGLTWIIGYFLLLETKPEMKNILSVAFCLCNTTQGIQIFVLFTLRTPIFKEKALALFKLIRIPVLARRRESFDVWAIEEADHEESYRSVNFDLDNLSVGKMERNECK